MGDRPSTYELIARAFDFVHDLEASAGEVSEAFDAALDEFLEAADDKIAATRAVVQRFEAEEQILASEIKRLQERKNGLSNRRAYLKGLSLQLVKAAFLLPNAPIDKRNAARLNFDTYSVAVATTRAVEVADEEAFIHRNADTDLVQIKRSVSKSAIKAALSRGEVKGARLVDRDSLRWS